MELGGISGIHREESAAFSLGESGSPSGREKGTDRAGTVFGDFFGLESREALEKVFTGCPYREDDIRKRLADFPLEEYFRGVDREEFCEFLAG